MTTLQDKNFWRNLKTPIMALAPMADVTDAAFRRIIAKYGKPDVMFTEFVSVEGLASAGREKLMRDLIYDESERPIVAQIFGHNPEAFTRAAELIRTLGFDGIDINMGCPDRKVCKAGAGAALIENPEQAKKIIRAVKTGAGDLPVSVKTRLGYNKIALEDWMKHLLEEAPAAITLHLRTKKEMSAVDAHWDEVHQAVALARTTTTLVIGNGDIKSIPEAHVRAGETGVHGVMLGRAMFGNPWLFNRQTDQSKIPFEEKLKVLSEHATLFEEIFEGKKNFAIMRKHFKAYIAGFPGAKELRAKLEKVLSARDLKKILDDFHYVGRDFERFDEREISVFSQNYQPQRHQGTKGNIE